MIRVSLGFYDMRFSKQSSFQKKLSRVKRNAPDFMVDIIDCDSKFLKMGAENRWPYSGNDNPEPFFIVGCGRSGNTLLRNLLMRKYYVCIPPEIPGLGNTIRSFAKYNRGKWDVVVKEVLSTFRTNADVDIHYPGKTAVYNLNKELGLDYADLEARLLALSYEERSLAAVLSELYSDYAKLKGMENCRIGDKTPWNVFHLGRISKVYPNAKFVHMLRDSRAVAASYESSLGEVAGITVLEAADRWKDSVKKCLRFEKRNAARVLCVKYEDLVNDSEQIVSEVACFLGLVKREQYSEYVPAMGDESLPHYKKSLKSVDALSINKWRTMLSDDEIEKINKITARLMRRVGYDL